MSLPTYTLYDLQQIEAEASAHLSAILETPVTITGPGADHPRCGASGTDVGNAREVTAHIGDEHIQTTYYSDLASAYEHDEPRKDYALCLANEIVRLWKRNTHRAAPAVHDDDEMTETETETI